MPKHLEELVLSKEADDLVAELELWLQRNGDYKPMDKKADLLEFANDNWEKKALPIGREVSKLIPKVALLAPFYISTLIR